MSVPELRVGVVGAGAIASAYGQLLAGRTGARPVGVADTVAESAARLADALGCPAFGSLAELLDRTTPDAVVICTPPDTHVGLSIEALAHGAHVLCEKPLALHHDGARRMLDEAERQGRVLTMASKFRFVEDVERARRLMLDGAIGDIVLVENAFTSHVDMVGRWNADPLHSGGGVLVDNGTHSIDLLRHLLGPLREVLAIAGPRVQPLEVEDTARLMVLSGSGVSAAVDLSWSIDKSREDFLEVYGSSGEIRVGWKRSRWRTAGGEWQELGSGYDKLGAMGGAFDDFRAACLKEHDPLLGPEDLLASVLVVQAAYRSLETHDWVPVRET